jgi:hypothetical protein
VFADRSGRAATSAAEASFGAVVVNTLALIARAALSLLIRCTISAVADSTLASITGEEPGGGLCGGEEEEDDPFLLFHYTAYPYGFLAYGAQNGTYWTDVPTLSGVAASIVLELPGEIPTHLVSTRYRSSNFVELTPFEASGLRQWLNLRRIPRYQLVITPLVL